MESLKLTLPLAVVCWVEEFANYHFQIGSKKLANQCFRNSVDFEFKNYIFLTFIILYQLNFILFSFQNLHKAICT